LISGRQREVLYLAAQGLTDRAIARRLAIAPRTVRMHLQMVREALGARNTTHAVAIALSWRILPDSAATATQI
jgi:DNA-binding CsgD family transcriptional regulator